MFTHSVRQILLLALTLLTLSIAAKTARACSCGPRPTVLTEFDESDVVIIARLRSVEKAADTDMNHYVGGIRSVTMVVDKIFKGNLKIRDELVFVQGGGANCVVTFSEQSIDEEFLFYLNIPRKNANDNYPPFGEAGMWYASTCGRSNSLDAATEDLLYLENMARLRGKTRISGTIGGSWRHPEMDVENKRIKITGPKKTYELKTDSHGVFEIYDLPPGKYLIEPEAPPGYKIEPFMLRYSSSVVRDDDDELGFKPIKQVYVNLEAKKHASVNFDFVIDNFVRGAVTGPNGKPMQHVAVNLWRTDQKDGYGPSAYTDEQGRFEITQAEAGEYVVVANRDGKLSSNQPFKTLFYPGVAERERAVVISIGAGGTLNDINIVVPKLEETILAEGTFRYSDGKPVADDWVKFKAEKADGIDGDSNVRTDAAGHFSIKILKGLKGELSSDNYLYNGKYVNCPKVDELIKKSGQRSTTVTTNVISLSADQNVYGLELALPFPRCQPAK
jgi:hypothetical protein